MAWQHPDVQMSLFAEVSSSSDRTSMQVRQRCNTCSGEWTSALTAAGASFATEARSSVQEACIV